MANFPRRGQIYWVDFDPVKGSEQGGRRPALIVSNEVVNTNSSVVVVVAMTSKIPPKKFPHNVHLPAGYPLDQEGVICCNQIRTVAKERLDGHRADLDAAQMADVDRALAVVLSLKLAA